MIAERMAAMRAAVSHPVALFLVGDFNSTAGSAVYKFLSQGFLDCSAEDRRDLSGQLAREHDFSSGWTPRLQVSDILQPAELKSNPGFCEVPVGALPGIGFT